MKVFGVGLQRTGTTSLNHALKILGYRSIHAPFDLYMDVAHPMLEQFDAFTDNPIPLLYKQLDQAHPGSKFVLTTRDLDGWMRSVEWLFRFGRIEYNWDAYPPIHEIHHALYGTTAFTPEVFKRTWEAYHTEVLAYFADRPGDLLVIDFTKGEGWERLCPFLGKPIPACPFPANNQATLKRTMRIRFPRLYRSYSALKARVFGSRA